MIVAAYRVLYGHEYLVPSIVSVAPYVDRIAIFWQPGPWQAHPTKGHQWSWEVIARCLRAVQRCRDAVHSITDSHIASRIVEVDSPGLGVRPENDMPIMAYHVSRNWPEAEVLMHVETDQLWSNAESLQTVVSAAKAIGAYVTAVKRDYWKSLLWMVDPPNPHAVLVAQNLMGDIVIKTGCDGRPRGAPLVNTGVEVDHLAHAESAEHMKLKHDLCQRFEATPQHADWFERVWSNWTPDMTNLCPVVGHEHCYARAIPTNPERIAAMGEILRRARMALA